MNSFSFYAEICHAKALLRLPPLLSFLKTHGDAAREARGASVELLQGPNHLTSIAGVDGEVDVEAGVGVADWMKSERIWFSLPTKWIEHLERLTPTVRCHANHRPCRFACQSSPGRARSVEHVEHRSMEIGEGDFCGGWAHFG